jgi:hypothetical protein
LGVVREGVARTGSADYVSAAGGGRTRFSSVSAADCVPVNEFETVWKKVGIGFQIKF